MRKVIFGIIICLLSGASVTGQNIPKMFNARRCTVPPKLDGVLDEPCWQESDSARGFICNSPYPGTPFRHATRVHILYTDEALYVGFVNFDSSPDSILSQLSGRDNEGNSDRCSVTFNCYRDGINGFTFSVAPTGEQKDARLSAGGVEDVSWNAVWDCHTRISDAGWIAEFQIPFAALRFPDASDQVWDINFGREVRRIRHKGFWNEVKPDGPPMLAQMGELTGISGIVPPKRIFFYPYLSTYIDWTEQSNGPTSRTTSYNGGMDMKLGLSDAFTLDATIIPDFGQTISDQLILNLTPFEIQFQDNRQFFIEGTELFSKGGIFYSRRIGGIPPGYNGLNRKLMEGETIVRNPAETQLINAVKISGRDKNGLGLGVFNAVTAQTDAEVRDENGRVRRITTSPLTNYNVVVADQNLRNNSYFAIVNANSMRDGAYYDANVTACDLVIRNKLNSYSLAASGALSQKYGMGPLRQESGFSTNFSVNKISGNWLWSAGQFLKSDRYDPNDLGFLQANNSEGYFFKTSYNIYKPFWKYNSLTSNVGLNYDKLYNPNTFTAFLMAADVSLTTRKFLTYNIRYEGRPVRGYDYFEPRITGSFFRTFTYNLMSGWLSSDYRKRLALDLSANYSDYTYPGRRMVNWRVSPRFRVNDRLMLIYVYSRQNHFNDVGFALMDESGSPVFGRRNVISHTNVLTVSYSFSPFMNVNCRVRHYWGFSDYSNFYSLLSDGELGPTTFNGFPNDADKPGTSLADRNFNSFTVDFFFRWNFRPGSELVMAWKNAVIQQTVGEPLPAGLADDVDYLFGLPQSNSLSLRVIYFLDYRVLTGRKGEAITRNSLN